jgi:NAD(P)-dependent dehydrogenase (short-subunit alcohol dehydrogenase family)
MTRWTQDDLSNQTGKTILVTGANSGLGLEAALAMARKGAHVIGTCRSIERGRTALAQIRAAVPDADVVFDVLDVADLASVRGFAARRLADQRQIDVLINNAGIMAVPERRTTVDGFELQLGTNHLGPFALTALLMPLLSHPGARVVMMTSSYYSRAAIRFDDLQSEKKYAAWPAYGQSKLANVLFMHELASRSRAANPGLVSVAAHPGIAKTNLQYAGPSMGGGRSAASIGSRLMRLMGQPPAQGVLPALYAATSSEVASGNLYGPDGRGQVRGYPKQITLVPRGIDDAVASKLWALSEELTGVPFAIAMR